MNKHVKGPSKIPNIYDLYAEITHEGGVSNGHYSTFAQNKGSWYWFNDHAVSEVAGDNENLTSANAYIMFFKR